MFLVEAAMCKGLGAEKAVVWVCSAAYVFQCGCIAVRFSRAFPTGTYCSLQGEKGLRFLPFHTGLCLQHRSNSMTSMTKSEKCSTWAQHTAGVLWAVTWSAQLLAQQPKGTTLQMCKRRSLQRMPAPALKPLQQVPSGASSAQIAGLWAK